MQIQQNDISIDQSKFKFKDITKANMKLNSHQGEDESEVVSKTSFVRGVAD